MNACLCLLFPPIIAVWLLGCLGKEKRKPIQFCIQYILATLVVNSLSFLVKCVIMKAGVGYIIFMLTDMPFTSALKYVVMSAAISVAYAVGIFVLQKFVLPRLQKSRMWLFVKQQFAVITARKVMGILLGVCFFAVFSLVYKELVVGIVSFVLFVVGGMLTCRPKSMFAKYTVLTVYTVAVVAALLFFPFYEIFAGMVWDFIRMYTPVTAVVCNGLLLMTVITLINVVTNTWKISVSITTAICGILTVINGYVYRFRGKEFIFPDIFSVVTAGNVAQNYDLRLQYHTFTMLALLTLLVFGVFAFDLKFPKPKIHGRVLSAMIGGILFVVFSLSGKDVEISTWKWDGTLVNGYYLNFYISARDHFVEKPAQYTDEYIRLLEHNYEVEKTEESEKKPNVLVIMSESYADFDVLGSELRTSEPVTPFWDSLKENTVKGYALTSVFGGTTANAEFEFLTGFTMNFLPKGATPYQQYIRRDTASLVWLLDSYGYRCMSTHPYLASGWNRTAVYPYLGFGESTFQEDYPGENLIRDYISDQEMFEYVLDELQKDDGLPLFLFGITMQNHGGYGAESGDFARTIMLEGYDQQYPEAEVYLSLLRQSDMALEYFLRELEAFEEDTIVLIFGDHFPQVEEGIYEELHGGAFDTLDSQMKQYTVPFMIWANFDIEESTVECTSLNYLGRYLLEHAGLELTPFYNFQKELEQHVPAISAMGYYSLEEGKYLPVENPDPEASAWLEQYKVLQYNGLIDKKKTSKVFFGDYIRNED